MSEEIEVQRRCVMCDGPAVQPRRYGHYYACTAHDLLDVEMHVGAYRPEPDPAAVEEARAKEAGPRISPWSPRCGKERWT